MVAWAAARGLGPLRLLLGLAADLQLLLDLHLRSRGGIFVKTNNI